MSLLLADESKVGGVGGVIGVESGLFVASLSKVEESTEEPLEIDELVEC